MISQLMVQGSPQQRPAIILSISPVTGVMVRIGASVQTVCLVWLNDAGDGTVFPSLAAKLPSIAPAKLPTPPEGKMGGHLQIIFFELTEDFLGDGSISLHDPCRDFFVSGPCCVLDQDPAILFCHLVSQTDGAIVILVCDLA